MAPPFKFSPEAIAFLKRQIPDYIRFNKPVHVAIRELGVTPEMLTRWRREDPEFDRAIIAAIAHKRATYGFKRTPEEIAELKRLIPDRIENGQTLTEVLREMDVTPDEQYAWRKADPAFDQRVKEAMEWLTQVKADYLLRIHEEIPDPKVATVAQSSLKWWLEKRNPKDFGPKIEVNDRQPNLIGVLQAAINRLIDQIPVPAQPLKAIASEPPRAAIDAESKQVTFRGDDPEASHRP